LNFNQKFFGFKDSREQDNEAKTERTQTEHREKQFEHFVVHGVHYAN
jgi:hypothetical protein